MPGPVVASGRSGAGDRKGLAKEARHARPRNVAAGFTGPPSALGHGFAQHPELPLPVKGVPMATSPIRDEPA